MGVPARATVRIEFRDDINNGDLQDAIDKIIQFSSDANSGKLTGDLHGDYDIRCDEELPFSISMELEVNSGRVQNLEWQLENIRSFLHSMESVIRMDADVWVMGDGVYFDKTQE